MMEGALHFVIFEVIDFWGMKNCFRTETQNYRGIQKLRMLLSHGI
jgi:hypothetical protein